MAGLTTTPMAAATVAGTSPSPHNSDLPQCRECVHVIETTIIDRATGLYNTACRCLSDAEAVHAASWQLAPLPTPTPPTGRSPHEESHASKALPSHTLAIIIPLMAVVLLLLVIMGLWRMRVRLRRNISYKPFVGGMADDTGVSLPRSCFFASSADDGNAAIAETAMRNVAQPVGLECTYKGETAEWTSDAAKLVLDTFLEAPQAHCDTNKVRGAAFYVIGLAVQQDQMRLLRLSPNSETTDGEPVAKRGKIGEDSETDLAQKQASSYELEARSPPIET